MKCPHCGLFNPDSAQRCDCGYDFASQQVLSSYLKQKPRAAHEPEPRPRRAEVWWLLRIVALIVGVAPIVAMMRELDTHTGDPGPMPGMADLGMIIVVGMMSAAVGLAGFVTIFKHRDAGSLVFSAG